MTTIHFKKLLNKEHSLFFIAKNHESVTKSQACNAEYKISY